MYQRSWDMFLGAPFNIASYGLFTHILAFVCGLTASTLTISTGDAHVYLTHVDAVREQLARGLSSKKLPRITFSERWTEKVNKVYIDANFKGKEDNEGTRNLIINGLVECIERLTFEDITLHDYEPLAAIKGEMAV